MHKQTLRIAVALAALTLPFGAFARPADVTGLSAHYENGQIAVHWDSAGDDIKAYRIYYGRRSILENEGLFDDFATTSGQNTEFMLTDYPPYDTIFLGVIAVDGNDEESSSFTEEVELPLSGDAADGDKRDDPDAPSPSRHEHETTTIGMTSAASLSSVLVQLKFTHPVTVDQQNAVRAFMILDPKGNALAIHRIVVEGDTVTLATEPQTPGMDYAVRASNAVAGDSFSGFQQTMDNDRNVQSFIGFDGPGAIGPSAHVTRPSPVAAAVTGQTTPPKKLFTSGAPLAGIMIASGAVAGWKRMRRKQAQAGERQSF